MPEQPTPAVLIVSHTHWDREWYRTFERFRACLVDVVDRALALIDADPDYHFLLDGQTIVVDDYLEIRPEQTERLTAAIRSGRIAIGPWYVQPDSLIPSGESHIRNLAMGRRVATRAGLPVSRVAYTPDSFGHPAMMPSILAGFGLEPFVYWRGNGHELDRLGARWRWVAPDGTSVSCLHLGEGYFVAGPYALPRPAEQVAETIAGLVERLAAGAGGVALVMNGADHTLPDLDVAAWADALSGRLGVPVQRGVLDDLPALLNAHPTEEPVFTGDLLGGREANLLPGVWSARMWIKLANRRAESELLRRVEPIAAVARLLGLPAETPTIERAWRLVLANCAHDSICGCSIDAVHRQMAPRYDAAIESATATAERILGRLAGGGPTRPTPWSESPSMAVFNPSPRARRVRVRLPLDGFPLYGLAEGRHDLHPLAAASLHHTGYTVDGAPARMVDRSSDTERVRLLPEQRPIDLEFLVDLPAMGWRRVQLAPGPEVPDLIDDGRTIETTQVAATATADGTFEVRVGGRVYPGLLGLLDEADAGDTYDADPRPELHAVNQPLEVRVSRRRHANGVAELEVTRVLEVPAGLIDNHEEHPRRGPETTTIDVVTVARVAEGVEGVEFEITVDNRADDHRLRLVLPTGSPTPEVRAATTLGVATRSTEPADASRWVHPAPTTFPAQGWVATNGLCVVAPGLPEAEARPDGTILFTLLRSVGWLSKPVLSTRPIAAGPGPITPEAQCHGRISTTLWVLPGDGVDSPVHPDDLEAAPVCAPADEHPVLAEGVEALRISPSWLTLSTFAPDPDGAGVVVRIVNPTADTATAELVVDAALLGAVTGARRTRLDGSPVEGAAVPIADGALRFDVAAHGHTTVLLELGGRR